MKTMNEYERDAVITLQAIIRDWNEQSMGFMNLYKDEPLESYKNSAIRMQNWARSDYEELVRIRGF